MIWNKLTSYSRYVTGYELKTYRQSKCTASGLQSILAVGIFSLSSIAEIYTWISLDTEANLTFNSSVFL